MRRSIVAACLLTSVSCTGRQAIAPATTNWPELPAGTKAVLLVTGGDAGFWKPQGCNQGAGGAQYRPALDRWLAQQHPEIERVWLSTGNTVDVGEESVESPESMLRRLRDVPYRAIAVGSAELAHLPLERLLALQRDEKVPLLSSHLFDRDAMEPLFPSELTLNLAGGRWVVLALGPDRRDWQQTVQGHGTIVTVDSVDAISARVGAARAAGEHVLLLSNLPQGDVDRVTRRVTGVDLIVATDGSVAFETPRDMNGTASLWLGVTGLRLGRVAIGDGGRVLAVESLVVRSPFPVDPTVDGTLQRH
ncbi:MAG: hypothetical protein U0V87_10490 [Acidobacteriota bacterium]